MKAHRSQPAPRLLLALALLLLPLSAVAGEPAPTRGTGRLIVKLVPDPQLRGASAPQLGAALRRPLSEARVQALSAAAGLELADLRSLADGAHVLTVGPGATRAQLAAALGRLRGLASVEYAEEDVRLFPTLVPDDPRYSALWSYRPPGAGSFGADFEGAWDRTVGAPGLVVAVLDSGILPHPDIVGPGGSVSPPTGALVSSGYDFITDCRVRASCPAGTANADAQVEPSPDATDLGSWVSYTDTYQPFFAYCTPSPSSWHGTHVAGTVGAIGNNGAHSVGAAFGVGLLPVRALGKCGGTLSDITEAIRWAAGVHPTIDNPHPARVINLSLGGPGPCSTSAQRAIDAAVAAGSVVVVAAGNEDEDAGGSEPANCLGVVVVGASDRQGRRAGYSNWGQKLSLLAPGGEMSSGWADGIYSTANDGYQTFEPGGWNVVPYQGTSMAAPHVSAALALMLLRNPVLGPVEAAAILTAPGSVTPFPAGSTCALRGGCGAGLLEARLALAASFSPLVAAQSVVELGVVEPGARATAVLELTNGSAAPVKTGTTVISGPGAADFSLGVNWCEQMTLRAGASCRMEVSYAPTAAGATSATVSVPTVAVGEDTTTVVSLFGAAGAKLNAEPAAVVLPPLTLGESATAQVVFTNRYLRVATPAPLRLSDPAALAVLADGCSDRPLEPGAACTVELTVTPVEAGDFAYTLELNTTGEGDVPRPVGISGRADAPPPAPQPPAKSSGCSVASSGAPSSLLLLTLLAGLAGRRRRR